MSRLTLLRAVVAVAVVLVFSTCRLDEGPSSPAAPSRPYADVTASPGPVTLVGAGNIAKCGQAGVIATAALLDSIPGTVFTVGDAAYDNGTLTQYTTCYHPTWGRQKSRTKPAPGDRDYKTANAAGYFGYFGAAAGDPKKGYYSYDLGAWHIVVLNSGSSSLVPITATSAQVSWLKSDLASHTGRCTLAYWHHPRFDSKDAPNNNVRPLWDVLYAGGVDVVVNAHYAFYERFAPQTPAGVADPAFGIREFVVGTGGAEHATPDHLRPNSEVRNGTTFGVLRLTLDTASYAWQFVPIAGQSFRDSGTGGCHGAPPISVNAGPDTTAVPGQPLNLSVAFSDPSTNTAPWTYNIAWGDGASSSGTTSSSPIRAAHTYSTDGLDSVRVTVTNSVGAFGADSLAVRLNAVLVGAGDVGDCTKNGDSLTANLLDTIPGTVFLLGDNAYPDGTDADYTNCYDPTWGRHKARTRPVPGNHDYVTPDATGYFNYFGAAAGDPSKGYYSYDVGAWHIVALNTNLGHATGSIQEQWLRADLAANPKACILAYWHHPVFSSSTVPVDTTARALWQDLYNAGAELILVGHHHNYERFAPQNPAGALDMAYGIREFVVGTGGGEGLFSFADPAPNSEVRNNDTFGVLKLTLSNGTYSWKFIPVAGKTFTDTGSGSCHGVPGNTAPSAVPGGPYSSAEGAPVAFDGSGSSDPDRDPLTYAWDFGDGTTATVVKPSHTYADNGSYPVTLTVTDSHGAASTATTTAAIANVAPAVSAGADQTVAVGSTFTLNAGFSDPGTLDAPWSYVIDWGDGSAPTTGSTTNQASVLAATHSYTSAGTDVVRVSVTDKDGYTGSGTLTVTVNQVVTTVTLVGAGNIARCDRTNDEATANLLAGIAGSVFALGDAAFPGGTPTSYQNCYDPTWGRQKARTYPVIGNRDYDSSSTAAGYFGYFGAAAGDPTKGYYSYDLGAWHIIVLNSNNTFVSTAAGSPQETWLRADLAANTKECVLAMWHMPRFYSTTSSSFFPTSSVKPFWDDLYAAHAELIINAHMRDYERFAPQTSTGVADPVNGIREIIVGTGGEGLDNPNTLIIPNSEINITGVYGVLQLTLGDGSYSWQFVPVAGATDSGSGSCH